jgi:membrane glycosyltransferase
MALKMRQSLAQLEEEFLDSMQREQVRDERRRRDAVQRTRIRTRARRKKRSSIRYWLLVASLIATAVGVTVAMFETLYYLLG